MEKAGHRRISVFGKLIGAFFAVVILVCAAGWFVFILNVNALTQEYEHNISQQIKIYFSTLERELDSIEQRQKTLGQDKDIAFLSFKNLASLDYDATSSINNLMVKLYYFKGSNRYVSDIVVDLVSLGRRLGIQSEKHVYEKFEWSELQTFLENAQLSNGLWQVEDQLYLLTFPNYHQGNEDLSNIGFLLTIRISKQMLLAEMAPYALSEDCSYGVFFRGLDTGVTSSELVQEIYDTYSDMFFENQGKTTSFRVRYNGKSYLALVDYSKNLDALYVQAIPAQRAFANPLTFRNWFIGLSMIIVSMSTVYVVFAYYVVRRPMRILIDAFQAVEEKDFKTRIDCKSTDDFLTVYSSFNRMTEELDRLVNDIYLQKILNQKVQLRQLQAQINPHFYYNTFFILRNRIANRQYGSAEKFCDMLGEFYLYLNKNNKDTAKLSDEIEHARIYSDIQAERFKERVTIQFDELPAQYENIIVPKLILQPIIENSFKYALDEKEYDGILRVSFSSNEEFLWINVEDNGEQFLLDDERIRQMNEAFRDIEGIVPETDYNSIGNIRLRLKLYFKGASDLYFSRSVLGGLKTTLKLQVESKSGEAK